MGAVSGRGLFTRVGNNLVISYRTLRRRPLCAGRNNIVPLVTGTTTVDKTINVHTGAIHSVARVGTIISLPIVNVVGGSCPNAPVCVAIAVGRISRLITYNISVLTIRNANTLHPSNSASTRFVHTVGTGCPSRLLVTSYSGFRGTVTYTRTNTSFINAAVHNCAPRARNVGSVSFTFIRGLTTRYPTGVVTRKRVRCPRRTIGTLRTNTFTLIINNTVAHPTRVATHFANTVGTVGR